MLSEGSVLTSTPEKERSVPRMELKILLRVELDPRVELALKPLLFDIPDRKGSVNKFVDVINDGELVALVVGCVGVVGVEDVEEGGVGVDGGRRGMGKGDGGGEVVGTVEEEDGDDDIVVGIGATKREGLGVIGVTEAEAGMEVGTVGGEEGNEEGLVISGTMKGSVLMRGGEAMLEGGNVSSGKRSGMIGWVVDSGAPESGGREGREFGNDSATACFMKLRRYVSCSFMSLFSVSSNSILAVT